MSHDARRGRTATKSYIPLAKLFLGLLPPRLRAFSILATQIGKLRRHLRAAYEGN
jgi:hypothetical protein